MKLTNKQLKQIIKEELEAVFSESVSPLATTTYTQENIGDYREAFRQSFGTMMQTFVQEGNEKDKEIVSLIMQKVNAFFTKNLDGGDPRRVKQYVTNMRNMYLDKIEDKELAEQYFESAIDNIQA